MKIKVIYSFFISLFLAIFLSSFFPYYKPVYFAPFLALSFFNTTLITSLYLSFLGGAVIDLLSSTHMGMNALIYTLCAACFFRQKKYFKDSFLSLSLFTILISFTYTFINVILLYVFEKKITISILWMLTDFVMLPIFDGIYAFLFYSLPLKGIEILINKKLIALKTKQMD